MSFKALQSLKYENIGSLVQIDQVLDTLTPSIKQRISSLNLSRNNLTEIDPGTFRSLPSLGSLYLDGNKLSSLPRSYYEQLNHNTYEETVE
ncbi:Leucine rich repeat containing 15 [Chamberlinius hualienensis]